MSFSTAYTKERPLRIRSLLAIASVVAVLSSASCADEPVATIGESLVEDGAKVEKIAGDLAFTEGPVWLPKTNQLVFSDIPNSKLMQWSESDGLSLFRESRKANGNILDLQGRLISCQHAGRNVVRTEPDGTITVLADEFEGKRFNSPNDVAVRTDGTLWFTDPPWGLFGTDEEPELPGNWVFRLNPETGEVLAVIQDMAMPNGIVFSPDGNRLYVADTGGHPRHQDTNFRDSPAVIRCYEITAEGALGKKLFQIVQGSDGMAVDNKGNIYTTHGGNVNVFTSDGELLQSIEIPENPANCTFGGSDFKTLFITARTSLYRLRMKNAGAKQQVNSH